ncbi:MAG: metalloregulator ArsR/SmtB family transcription factor [Acidobacteriota bacterium]
MPVSGAVKTFKALSETTRLRIMVLLARRNLCVCELMFVLKMEQSRVSHQLKILRDAGLVEDVRKGRWIIYRIPGRARKTVEALLEAALRPELGKSAQVLRDVERMNICAKLDVRRTRQIRPPAARGRGAK